MSLASKNSPRFFGKLFGQSNNLEEIPAERRPELFGPPKKAVANFQPDELDLCFCGSEKFFKSCCGSTEKDRKPPYGVHVIENYLSEDIVIELRDYFAKQTSEPLTVIDDDLSTPDNIVTKMDDQRISERVDMGEYYPKVSELIRSAFIDLSDKCMGVKMDWCEPPQLLRYYPGGFYLGHADCENQHTVDRTWTKVIDRDLSLLIYLNEDFEGGHLLFNKFNYYVKPKAGTAVIFPSDHRFLHTAQKVESGIRLAIVSWGAVNGIEKVAKSPPQDAMIEHYKAD